MLDYVKLLIRVIILTNCIDCIDWHFLCEKFMNLGPVVWILNNFYENNSYLPQTPFAFEMKELGIFTLLLFCNILIQGHKGGLEWKMNWSAYEPLSNHLSFWTDFVFPAQKMKKRCKFENALSDKFLSKILIVRED